MTIVKPSFRLAVFSADSLDRFSGIPRAIVNTMREVQGLEVIVLDSAQPFKPQLATRVSRRVARALTGKSYLWDKQPARCRYYSQKLDAALSNGRFDACLVFGVEMIGNTTTDVPLYCYADSLFGSRLGLYPDQQRDAISSASMREGRLTYQRGLDRLDGLFVSSQWAIDKAISEFGYSLKQDLLQVVGIGASLPKAVSVTQPPNSQVRRYTWVGVDWQRKRGDFAVAVVEAMRRREVEASLDIVGLHPKCALPDWVRCHGRLSYAETGGFDQFVETMSSSWGLLLPTSADLTPQVIAEAFAFGKPVFATPVGGIPEMVQTELHGILVDSNSPEIWAERILSFESLALTVATTCRAAYTDRWNWPIVCKKMLDRIIQNPR